MTAAARTKMRETLDRLARATQQRLPGEYSASHDRELNAVVWMPEARGEVAPSIYAALDAENGAPS